MKKTFLALLSLMVAFVSNAQIDFTSTRIELAGNYTMYKGDFQESTPGLKLRVSVPVSEKMVVGLAYTHGLPIKSPSTVTLDPSGSVNSEIIYNFKTITLDANYIFGGEKELGFNFYGTVGVGLVLATYKENLKESIPPGSTPIDMISKETQSGFTINGGIGTQYSLGKPKIFAEALIAFPANQVNGQYVENVIPAHFIFNVGIRLSLGGGYDY